MHKMKSFVSCAIALIIAAAAVLSVSASVEGVDSVYDSTSEYLCSGEAPSVGSIGGEWTVIGLARSGRITDSFAQGYYSNLAAYLKKAGKAQLDENKATENARVILALTAIKKDPSDVEGFNLFEPLSEMDFVTYQGINGAIWTLLAFDSYCYEIPISEEGKNQTTRESLIEAILDEQLNDGGWDLVGISSDTDLTAMAITALAPYYDKYAEVKTAVDKALDLLSSIQRDSGAFNTFGADSPETEAQVLTALCSMGIDPTVDSRFLKNGKGCLDALMSFYIGGGFRHSLKTNEVNRMSTEQAFYALTAYFRSLNAQTALFDMTDNAMKYDVNLDGRVDVTDATAIQKLCAGLAKYNLLQHRLADADGNGSADVVDATYIQKMLVKQG